MANIEHMTEQTGPQTLQVTPSPLLGCQNWVTSISGCQTSRVGVVCHMNMSMIVLRKNCVNIVYETFTSLLLYWIQKEQALRYSWNQIHLWKFWNFNIYVYWIGPLIDIFFFLSESFLGGFKFINVPPQDVWGGGGVSMI